MARGLRAWAINQREKTKIRNLQCGPRTRLVRGIYYFLLAFKGCGVVQFSYWECTTVGRDPACQAVILHHSNACPGEFAYKTISSDITHLPREKVIFLMSKLTCQFYE